MSFIRAPYIESVGDEVQVLTEAGGKIVAARQGAQLVTAFHPELDKDRRVHGVAGDLYRERKPRNPRDNSRFYAHSRYDGERDIGHNFLFHMRTWLCLCFVIKCNL